MKQLTGLFLFLTGPLILFADDPKPAKVAAENATLAGEWTVDDVLNAEYASDFHFSPTGQWIVWTKTVMSKEWGEASTQLMRTNFKEFEDIELTRGDYSCTSPRWSPDGKLIAFLSDRPAPKSDSTSKLKGKSVPSRNVVPTLRGGALRPVPSRSAGTSRRLGIAKRNRASDSDSSKQQIWLINPFGGEPWRLTNVDRGVTSFDWATSGNLVFLTQEDESYYEQKISEDEDTSTIVEDQKHEPPARLFRVDVNSKKVTRLTDNTDQIDYLAVSPDGKWAVARHNRSLRFEFDANIKPILFLHDLEKGTSKQVFADPKFNIDTVAWTWDSKGFYTKNDFNSNPRYNYPSVAHLHFYNLATGAENQVELDWPNGLGTQDANDGAAGFVVINDGFIALLANGVRNKLAKYTRNGDGWKREWLEGEHASNVFGLAVSRDGKNIGYAYSTASNLTEWRYAPLDKTKIAKSSNIGTLNTNLKDKPMAKSEIIRWKGALDEEVEGILFYPHEYEKGKKQPLIVMIHGGPNSADVDMWADSWHTGVNLYCQRGAFVLMVNYHGSTNYGLKWVESITNGKYYDLEVPDIEKGVDHLIAKGLVDKDKLGVLGWSNGSILTIALTVATTRYKAAAAGAGTVEYFSDWANCDFGDTFDRIYLGKSPLEDPKLYFEKSPFFKLEKVRTPTLIFFGSDDRTVPTHNGWAHYRGLQQLGKTDVRFVLFPGEKHGLSKLAHQKRKLEEELAWFDKHLFQTTKEKNEAFKEDSPLAQAIKRQSAKRDKGLFGTVIKDSSYRKWSITAKCRSADLK